MTVDKSLTFEFRDEYNRKPIAKKIIRLLESDVDVSPLVVDGGWGTGKSEFCYKLINLLDSDENTQLRPVYVDAFKADHADEPLMTLLASVLKLLPDAEQKTLVEKALPAIRFGTKTLLKGAVSWVLKQDATDVADDFEDVLKDAGDDVINHTIESMLADHVKADESIKTLRTALKELAKDMPIVIFVDELDRCRPDFAISLLESIKHVFNVEGVQFILVVNTDQLKASVNHCYGVGVNAQQYLDKFIGYKFPIPSILERNIHRSKLVSVEHFINIINEGGIEVNEEVLLFSKELISLNKLSLREVETFIKFIEIYKEFTDGNGLTGQGYGKNLLSIFGVYLSCFKPELVNYVDVDLTSILKILGEKPSLSSIQKSSKYRHAIVVAASILLDDEVLVENELEETVEYWNPIVREYFSDHFGREYEKMPQIGAVADILCLK